MENHHVAERDDNNGSMDRISQLPHPILHSILSFLSQNDAVKTSVLSKSWRYLWYGRPNLEFRQPGFRGNRNTFISVVDAAMQRFIAIQDFFLEISFWVVDSKSTQLLEKWVSTVLQNKGLKTFRLHIRIDRYLPPIVFNSESLRELHLRGCTIGSVNDIMLKNLQTLCLTRVDISEATLEHIFSSCPLLEDVSLLKCEGFKTIHIANDNKLRGLKHFAIEEDVDHFAIEEDVTVWRNVQEIDRTSIEIDISTIETITIIECRFRLHNNNYFPNLKSLTLKSVRLSNESFEIFSPMYMPRLECLTLDSFYGFEEIKMLLSDSVKHVTIRNPDSYDFRSAVIDAPNIATFLYEDAIDLHSGPVSFVTNFTGWVSKVKASFYYINSNDPSSWFGKMNEQLRALSGSRISLELSQVEHNGLFEEVHYGRKCGLYGLVFDQRQEAFYERVHAIIFSGRDYEPVLVEHLSLRGRYTHSSLVALLYCLFRICRPRYVGQGLFSNDKELTLLLFVILVMEREMREQYWPGGLEDVKMESFDGGNGQGSAVKFRFRLKWRDHLWS